MNKRIFTNEFFDSLRKHLDSSKQKYVAYPKFIFLCGRAFSSDEDFNNSNRGVIKKFITSKDSLFNVVLSEKLWEEAFSSELDLLTFEEFLAEVSDFIILFPESEGSFCELGAFSYATERFCQKLIIINDYKYKDSISFVNTGPIAKAKANGAKLIHANLNKDLMSSKELRDTIADIIKDSTNALSSKNHKIINRNENEVNVSSFIYELLELVKLLQPINSKDLIDVYKTIKGFENFSFAQEGKSESKYIINIRYIYKLLQYSKIINIDENNLISLVDHSKIKNLMFKYQGQAADKERSKLLCRKYKYGEQI